MQPQKETTEVKREELRSLLSTQHRQWEQHSVTVILLRHVDERLKQLSTFAVTRSTSADVTEMQLRLALAQQQELEKFRKLIVDNVEFVTKSVK